jgi:hypothetical protein
MNEHTFLKAEIEFGRVIREAVACASTLADLGRWPLVGPIGLGRSPA